ncbi:MAG: hypothetical protein F9K44_02035 [Hyphomicrobiaceae bacterium]|nr:MAG: hypothetical protein F9K44_02035 [Hyphomicrobiaceae bacterium]
MADPSFADGVLARRRRIEYRLAILIGDQELVSSSRRSLREGRDEFETRNPPDWIAANLLADMRAAASLKDRETIDALSTRAKSLFDRLAKARKESDAGYRELALAFAVAGDEAAMTAALGKLKDDKEDWKLAGVVAEACIDLARHGHIEPALRCATRVEATKRPLWEFRSLKVHAEIASALSSR